MAFVNRDQAEFWSSRAPTWISLEHRLETTAGAPGRMAMERLDPRPGQRILDLGCGTGPTTVELAARVRPGGAVVGVDIAYEMLVRARERAADEGLENVDFLHADVQAGDLGAGEYDGAFSRFGVMFYSDPVAAFTNVRGRLRPGGRLAFVCWQGVFANEWMLVPGMAVMSVTGTAPPMPAPGEPGPFSLCDADRVLSILGDAGFTDIEAIPHSDFVAVSEAEIPDYASAALEVGAAREALSEADDATREKAYEAVVEALQAKADDGEVRLTRGVLIVTGKA